MCWCGGMPVGPFLVRPSWPFASSGSRLPWGGRWLPRGPEPASLGSRDFLPSRAEPSRAEPSQAEPSRAEPSRAEPSRAEPSRAEPSRAIRMDVRTYTYVCIKAAVSFDRRGQEKARVDQMGNRSRLPYHLIDAGKKKPASIKWEIDQGCTYVRLAGL